MKDIERIQSTELAAQVQDANPGNFGIEQEVAAMVGATVPAPTEPSADDARELGAQLLVFLRRALLPIKSALRTALADIYAHLDSRCTDYTPAGYFPASLRPYDPMGSTPRTLPNLLTAITAFSARKISNGSAPNDGIPDGTSLAHIICNGASVTEVLDDNTPWDNPRYNAVLDLLTIFPNATKMTLNMRGSSQRLCWINTANPRNIEFFFPYFETVNDIKYIGGDYNSYALSNASIHIPAKETHLTNNGGTPFGCKKLFLDGYCKGEYRIGGSAGGSNSYMTYIYCGCYGSKTDVIRLWHYYSETVVTDVELRQGARQPITLQNLDGLTAENIVNHIFEKLAYNSDGDPITINIGSTNLAKLTDEQKAIAQNKNYTLA